MTAKINGQALTMNHIGYLRLQLKIITIKTLNKLPATSSSFRNLHKNEPMLVPNNRHHVIAIKPVPAFLAALCDRRERSDYHPPVHLPFRQRTHSTAKV